METVELRVRAGELFDAGSWLYAWFRQTDRRVVYVGGTGLPPAVRTWLTTTTRTSHGCAAGTRAGPVTTSL